MEDPRRRAIALLPRWGLGLVACGLAMAAEQSGPVRSLGLGLALLGASVLLARLFVRQDTVHEARQREQAEAFVRWSLGAEEWQRYLEHQAARAGVEARKAGAVFVGLAAAVAAGMPLFGATVPEAIVAFAVVSIFGLVFSFAVGALSRRQLEQLRRAPPEVVLGPGFGRVGAHELRWHRRAPFFPGGWELAEAELRPDPPGLLVLGLRWRAQGIRQLFPRIRLEVPVPAARLDEARDLVAAEGPLFRAR